MTENVLNLRTDIRILINGDPERVVQFDPSDIVFAERFYKLIGVFEAKQAEYQERAKELDARGGELDANGLPANLGDSLAFLREVCEFMHAQIDYLFGAGTSRTVFGAALSMNAIEQFFEGVTPFIQQTRSEKVAKYSPAAKSRKVMR